MLFLAETARHQGLSAKRLYSTKTADSESAAWHFDRTNIYVHEESINSLFGHLVEKLWPDTNWVLIR
jgi:hypothetical protein